MTIKDLKNRQYKVRRLVFILFIYCSFSALNLLKAQKIVDPQLYNNLAVSVDLSSKWTIFNQFSFNVLMSDKSLWNETSILSIPSYRINKNISAIGGFYISYVNQNKTLSSLELRPSFGIIFSSTLNHRFSIGNTSRIEFRFMNYSDADKDFTLRFRNRTDLIVSLIKPKINMNKNLFLFAHFEIYYNFEENIRERFYNIYRIKLGLGYRLSFPWRFSLGVLYQDSELNIGEPTNQPTNVITNYIFEWRVIYVIDAKK